MIQSVFQVVVMTTLRACPTLAAVSLCSRLHTMFDLNQRLIYSGLLPLRPEGFNGLEDENGEADFQRFKTVTSALTMVPLMAM